MITIDEILKELNHSDHLRDILRIIYCYYLTEKDKENYEILLMYLDGKPQRELGILIGTQQFKVSRYLSKLLKKMRGIGDVFLQKDILQNFLIFLKNNCSQRQYMIVSYLFAGNKYYQIARQLKCSISTVYYTLFSIKKRLPESQLVLFEKFLSIFT